MQLLSLRSAQAAVMICEVHPLKDIFPHTKRCEAFPLVNLVDVSSTGTPLI